MSPTNFVQDDDMGSDFDIKIAGQLFRDTIDELIRKVMSSGYEIAQVLFPVGQDYFHFDNPKV